MKKLLICVLMGSIIFSYSGLPCWAQDTNLKRGLGIIETARGGRSIGFSFNTLDEILLHELPALDDIYVYLEVKDQPVLCEDARRYFVALVGIGVEFCEIASSPSEYIDQQQFRDELLQAPESGYVSRIEANNPMGLRNKCFYFKTREGEYGKLYIGHIGFRYRVRVNFEYYFQPDGTRDLAVGSN